MASRLHCLIRFTFQHRFPISNAAFQILMRGAHVSKKPDLPRPRFLLCSLSVIGLLVLILVLLVLFGTFWVTSIVVAAAGGWKTLAKNYRHEGPLPELSWKKRSAFFRPPLGVYKQCITFGANTEGLFVAMRSAFASLLLFRRAHPDLFIPWDDLSAQTVQEGKFLYLRLTPSRAPNVPITIYMDLAKHLQAAAGASWPH